MIVKTLDEGTLREIGAAFANYDYGDEKGLASLFSSRAATAEYIYGYARRVRSARCACARSSIFSRYPSRAARICGRKWIRRKSRISLSVWSACASSIRGMAICARSWISLLPRATGCTSR